jgi:hypothetical protein
MGRPGEREKSRMVFEAPELSWRHHIKRPVAWVFAIAIGLLVSIADVKLPAETSQDPIVGATRSPAEEPGTIPGSDGVFSEASDRPDSSAFPSIPAREPAFEPLDLFVHQAAGRYDVDFNLIYAIISAESQFNPRARSKKGAKGMMQLMPITADELDVDDIYDPEENIDAGVRYFRILLDRFEGDVELALAAYNAGPKKVIRHDGVPPYRQTRTFISRVFDYYAALKDDWRE